MKIPSMTKIHNHNKAKTLLFFASIILGALPFHSMAESSTYEETLSAGNRTYDRFCSVCHGKEAKGNGIYKENLKISPSDLTILASKNNDTFPWIMMYQIIDGNDITIAHGTNEMPIWGELFDISNWDKGYKEHSKAITRGRIFEVLVYLDFIQEE